MEHSIDTRVGARAKDLLDYEWDMLVEALERDMCVQQQKAGKPGPWKSVHGYNARVIERILHVLREDGRHTADATSLPDCESAMTARERDIANLLTQKKTGKEIGRALGISHRTVDVYRSRLLQKFRATSTQELLRRCLPLTAGTCALNVQNIRPRTSEES